jgi:hypothetical protein
MSGATAAAHRERPNPADPEVIPPCEQPFRGLEWGGPGCVLPQQAPFVLNGFQIGAGGQLLDRQLRRWVHEAIDRSTSHGGRL